MMAIDRSRVWNRPQIDRSLATLFRCPRHDPMVGIASSALYHPAVGIQ
jgi:hypothetical protein